MSKESQPSKSSFQTRRDWENEKNEKSREITLNFQIQIIHVIERSMASGIKRYDFYRKAIDGLQTKTSIGGLSKFVPAKWFLVSLISGFFIFLLVALQTVSFVKTKTSTTLNVESQLDKIIPSKLDFSLFYMPCDCIGSLEYFICSFWCAFREHEVKETNWYCCMSLTLSLSIFNK